MGYTKLFSDIVMSTIWREPDHVRIVWVTMLALADKDSTVHGSVPGLADAARVSLEQCEDAIDRLSSPDEYSRTKDYEGRRITAIDGGWHLLNGQKYRAKMSVDERRRYKAEKAREYRARDKAENERCRHGADKVDKSRQPGTERSSARTLSTQAEAEAEAEAEETISASASADDARLSSKDPDFSFSKNGAKKIAKTDFWSIEFAEFWAVVHWKKARETARKAFIKAVKRVAEERKIKLLEASDMIRCAMIEFAQSPEADPKDRTAVYPATWLNGGQYDDDPETWQETNGRKRITF